MTAIAFDAKRAFYNHSGLGAYSRFVIDALDVHTNNRLVLAKPNLQREEFYTAPASAQVLQPLSTNYIANAYWRSKGCVQDVADSGAEVFHGLSAELPIAINKVIRKTVVTMHDLIFMRYPHYFRWHDQRIFKWKAAAACEAADKIIAVSKMTADDLMELLRVPAHKIEVIGQGCNPIFFRPISSAEKSAVMQKYGLE